MHRINVLGYKMYLWGYDVEWLLWGDNVDEYIQMMTRSYCRCRSHRPGGGKVINQRHNAQ